MKLTLLAIMQDEAQFVDRWVDGLRRFSHIHPFDEVLVVDGGSTDGTVELLQTRGIQVFRRPFGMDFAEQRNAANAWATGDWVFELDADEVISEPLLAGMRAIIRDADEHGVDCVGIPRLNFINSILVASPGYKGLDYQYRLHRRGLRWQGRVHESLRDYKARVELSLVDGHFLVHDKPAARHEARNQVYCQME